MHICAPSLSLYSTISFRFSLVEYYLLRQKKMNSVPLTTAVTTLLGDHTGGHGFLDNEMG